MTYQVDKILNDWFGEQPEHSDDEHARIKQLYAPLRELERQLIQLQKKASDSSWASNPDRSGGQFTLDEIYRYDSWT